MRRRRNTNAPVVLADRVTLTDDQTAYLQGMHDAGQTGMVQAMCRLLALSVMTNAQLKDANFDIANNVLTITK